MAYEIQNMLNCNEKTLRTSSSVYGPVCACYDPLKKPFVEKGQQFSSPLIILAIRYRIWPRFNEIIGTVETDAVSYMVYHVAFKVVPCRQDNPVG